RRLQHRQPEVSASTSSSRRSSRCWSMASSPTSLTSTAIRSPFGACSRARNSVVLPAPKKPVTTCSPITATSSTSLHVPEDGLTYQHLIDVHVHLNNYHESSRRPTVENVRELFAKMDEIGVAHAVVITSYRVDMDRPSIEEVIELLTDNPRITLVEG